jgi:hypothetical protein
MVSGFRWGCAIIGLLATVVVVIVLVAVFWPLAILVALVGLVFWIAVLLQYAGVGKPKARA